MALFWIFALFWPFDLDQKFDLKMISTLLVINFLTAQTFRVKWGFFPEIWVIIVILEREEKFLWKPFLFYFGNLQYFSSGSTDHKWNKTWYPV